jgi:hypothetical protein
MRVQRIHSMRPCGFIVARTLVLAWMALSLYVGGSVAAQESTGVPYRIVSQSELDRARVVAEGLATQIDAALLAAPQLRGLYATAGLALRKRYSESTFSARLAAVRAPLGALQARKFSGLFGPYHNLPNIIGGDYLIIVFSTRFQGQENTYTEQITLEADRSGAGSWSFVEYYVAPEESRAP